MRPYISRGPRQSATRNGLKIGSALLSYKHPTSPQPSFPIVLPFLTPQENPFIATIKQRHLFGRCKKNKKTKKQLVAIKNIVAKYLLPYIKFDFPLPKTKARKKFVVFFVSMRVLVAKNIWFSEVSYKYVYYNWPLVVGSCSILYIYSTHFHHL